VNIVDSNPPATLSDSQERKVVFLLCLLATIHVFVFSAAFPFFNNVDEQTHFDLVVKYSQGRVPRALEPVSPEATPYVVIYGSREYFWASNHFPIEQFPPPWTQPMEKIGPKLLAWEASWNKVINHETSQPPVYYALAGLWWHLGMALGLHDGFLLYWLRFLNGLFVAALVWLGFAGARMIFPKNPFLKLGVPVLLAFMPQTAFYSIQNDALSPVCFGVAFICLAAFWRTESPGVRLGTATGLALAATYLTKISNLPLLIVSVVVVSLKIRRLAMAGQWRVSRPALAALALCAGLPIGAWLAWMKYNFGDFTGTMAKIQYLNWTYQPFNEWWGHPIFTLHGLWTFMSGLLSTFWQGEFLWHRQPLAFPTVDVIYAVLSISFVGLALLNLHRRSTAASGPQRQTLWFGFWSFAAAIAFLAFLSIIFDFGNCPYPSRARPYFTSGRLMLGALIPFMLLFTYGLDCALNWIKNRWTKPLVLAGLVLFMLISEIVIDWPIFPNAYNLFHM
jgi:Predicted membrane protein (DUF2142)